MTASVSVAAAATTGRVCAWCLGPIAEGARRDAVTCSKRCRQARHRFVTEVGQASSRDRATGSRRLAYADPPYPGKAGYYRDHPDYGGEVDHAELITRLVSTYDAWALSTSARSLPDVLALCPPGVRVAAWFRGHRPHATATTPLNAWEPVIYAGQIRRARPAQGDVSCSPDASRGDDGHLSRGDRQHVADHHGDPSLLEGRPVAEISSDTSRQYSGRVAQDLIDPSPLDRGHVAAADLDASRRPGERLDTLHYFSRPRLTDSGRVIGAKPAAFCRWIFELLGAQPGDELVDVFPGSGGIGRAWDIYTGAAS